MDATQRETSTTSSIIRELRALACRTSFPQSDYSGFEVQYLDTQQRMMKNSTDQSFITIGNLRPFRNYTFTIVTRSGSPASPPIRRSLPVSVVFETKESVPGSLNLFEPIEVLPDLGCFSPRNTLWKESP